VAWVVPWAMGVAVVRSRGGGAVARRRHRGAARGLLGYSHGDGVAIAWGCGKGTSGQETGGEKRAERHVGLETNGLESEKDAARLAADRLFIPTETEDLYIKLLGTISLEARERPRAWLLGSGLGGTECPAKG